jgi:hypothetical protein
MLRPFPSSTGLSSAGKTESTILTFADLTTASEQEIEFYEDCFPFAKQLQTTDSEKTLKEE